ncbi:hypothetical protein PR003_g6219 [Phytophthora rubi]|uniref:Ankyrin repeat domain-containing protein n=1 Tax=Phytophthora rubi TaxID=129364 RepID=A0A6A4FQA8_9STRA|nr:hypothetical protein PR001_g5057 [Phytophthora rubi]KAE9348815.1 hypothetical protein PR003_g6219 [Phytophthora rubi]
MASAAAPPSAATLVLTNRSLFRLIMVFIDGIPGSVVSLVTDFQRAHVDVPWSFTGVLPRAAIQRGDVETLRHLRRLATTRRFQSRSELALDGATRCAIQFGQLAALQYLDDSGILLGDRNNGENLSDSRTVGETLMGWAIRYSEALETPLRLEIVQWVADKYRRSAFRDVKAEDLSRAGVPVLRFLQGRGLATSGFEDPRLVDLVATRGKMETLTFLLGGGREGKCTTDAMDGAAANGHLEVVRYLHTQRTEGCTAAAMDGAARNGHLDVVQFLHSERSEGCTVAAMDGAARNGHVETVKFLHTQRTEGCTTAAMDGAAGGGFLDVVRFLHEQRGEGCTTKAMDGAARSGHLEVVKFLHTHRNEGCTTDAMDGAALVGRLPIIRFLHENRQEGCTTRAIDGAAWRGHLDVVKYLMSHRSEGCTSKAMDTACQSGYVEIVRFLHEQRTATCTTAAMDSAASGGHLEIVQFLQENRVEGCTKDAMTNAAINGHADVVLFLGEHRHEGPDEFALERAAAQGHVDCVDALIRCSMRGCLFEARRAALQAGHPRVAALLSAWMNPEVRSCSSQYYHVYSAPRWCQRQPQPTTRIETALIKTSTTVKMEKSSSAEKPSGWFWWFRWR